MKHLRSRRTFGSLILATLACLVGGREALAQNKLTYYSTGFNDAPLGATTWNEYQIWAANGPGAGMVAEAFAGQGRAAYLGFATTPGAEFVTVTSYQPMNPLGDGRRMLSFSMDFAVQDSTNGKYDFFYINVLGSAGFLATLTLDNRFLDIYASSNAEPALVDTGFGFPNNVKLRLVITLDLGINQWSASIEGIPIVTNKPLAAAPGDYGFTGLSFAWGIADAATPGDNFLLVDNVEFAADSGPYPYVQIPPLSQTVVAGADAQLTVVATGAAPLSYEWRRNNVILPDATGPTLNFTNATAADAGIYRVTVHNEHGFEHVYALMRVLASGAAVSWGGDALGAPPVPGNLGQLINVAAGSLHALGLRPDGTVAAWGSNSNGQATPPAGLSGVTAIAAGNNHSLALKSDGTVAAWGRNVEGQTNVPAGLTGVTAISAGENHNLALKGDGTVVAWGRNAFGEATVPSGLSEVVAISAGGTHSLALKRDGTVVAWGANFDGQTTVPPELSGVVAVAAGGLHGLALRNNGTVAAWGSNLGGQTTVPPGLTGVIAIAAAGAHSLALKSDGTVVAWGDNSFGQINVPAELTGVTALAASIFFNLAITPLAAPVITQEPLGAEIAAGDTVALSVTATGEQLAYQWYAGVAGDTSAPVADATAAEFTTPPLSANASYWVRVSNPAGQADSLAAALLVLDPLDNWTWRNPTPQGDPIKGFAWNGTLFVGVGDAGRIITSPDGENWAVRSFREDFYATAVLWTGSEFIAVGGQGRIRASVDGVTWTTRVSPTVQFLQTVAQGNGVLVAAGAGSALLLSTDGVTWTPQTASGFSGTFQDMVWTGDKFVVLGAGISGTSVLTSTDGSSWTVSADLSPASLTGLAWNGSLLVATGLADGGEFFTSTNGVNWTPQPDVSSLQLNKVRWANGLFVAVGAGGQIYTSTNGTTWMLRNSGVTFPLTAVAYGAGRWIAAGQNTLLQSANGASWAQVGQSLYSTSRGFNAVTWNGARWVAVGGTPRLAAISDDGVSWSNISVGSGGTLYGVAWNGSVFAAVGNAATATSPDGETWSTFAQSGYMLYGVTVHNGLFVAVGSVATESGAVAVILSSPDGANWTQRFTGTFGQIWAVTHGDGQFVAVGEFGRVFTSPNGVNWTQRASGFSQALNAVAWSGSAYLAVGFNGRVLTSPDGVTWTARTAAVADNFTEAVWTGERFVIAASGRFVQSSPDGITWTAHDPVTASNITGFGWDGSLLVAVTSTGGILTTLVTPPSPPSGYAEWAAGLGLSGPAADLLAEPFGGGLPNIARFALGLGAQTPADALPFTVAVEVDGASYLQLVYRQRKFLDGVVLGAQFSDDLLEWEDVPSGSLVLVGEADADTALRAARMAVLPGGRLFLRLVFSRPADAP